MDNHINEKVGAWLVVPGNSRSMLADACGITRQTLCQKLNGSSAWKWNEVVTISKTIGCSLNELAGIGKEL